MRATLAFLKEGRARGGRGCSSVNLSIIGAGATKFYTIGTSFCLTLQSLLCLSLSLAAQLYLEFLCICCLPSKKARFRNQVLQDCTPVVAWYVDGLDIITLFIRIFFYYQGKIYHGHLV
jgi:hypothetical protein